MESYTRYRFISSLFIIASYLVTVLDQPASATPLHLNSTFENFFSGNFLFENHNQNKLGYYRVVGELNDSCSWKKGCREYAYRCSASSVCECAQGYMPDQLQQICVGGIGSRCFYDSHCIPNAYCKGQEICACKFEFPIPSADNWTCKSSASYSSNIGSMNYLLSGIVSIFWIIHH